MKTSRSLLMACGAVVLGLVAATTGDAGEDASRSTKLTFSAPIGLPGVTLPAGTYTFELAAPDSDLDVVRVMNRDRSIVYLTALTMQVTRPIGLRPGRTVTFNETPRGVAPRISTWYPIGQGIGHQFVYPTVNR